MIIPPSITARLWFHVIAADNLPVQDLTTAGITSAAYVTITAGVRSAPSTITLGAKVDDTAAHMTGQLVTVKASEGWYAIDAPAGAALATADYAELVVVLVDGTRLVYPTLHRIDVAVSTRNAVTPPTVAQLNARTLLAADYFDPAADTVARVTLVDTTTVNADMRGTDGANTTTPPTAASIASAVWDSVVDSSGVSTLLSRITGLLQTKSQADAANDAIPGAVRTELATELARIDADISSRNATAPDNAGIAAIQADVDALPKYGDTTKRTLVSDGPTELTETITRVP